jgi:hypothetical protein
MIGADAMPATLWRGTDTPRRFRLRISGNARLLDRLVPQRATALVADRIEGLLDA